MQNVQYLFRAAVLTGSIFFVLVSFAAAQTISPSTTTLQIGKNETETFRVQATGKPQAYTWTVMGEDPLIEGENVADFIEPSENVTTVVLQAFNPGTCQITAQANGMTLTSGTITVIGPAPKIQGISPDNVPAGTPVEGVMITGSGFSSPLTVTFGDTAASVFASSATDITCTAPALSAGWVDVVVINPDGQSATLADGFEYVLPPNAAFTYTPTSGTAPLTVQFTDTSMGRIDTRIWDFGDGATDTAQNPGHTYTDGNWVVVLTVTNVSGSESYSQIVNAFSPTGPAITGISPNSAPADTTAEGVVLTGSGFGSPLTVTFGDTAASVSASSATDITCTAPALSAGVVDVVVTNPDGQAATLSRIFEYVAPPVAGFTADPSNGTAPLTVQFTDGSTGLIDTWTWDFGDGGTDTVSNPSHTYTVGQWTAALTVTGAGGSDTYTRAIEVARDNKLPIAQDQNLNVSEDRSLNLTLQAMDGDGDPLTYTVTVMPIHGTLSGQTPELTYTPAANFNGLDSFMFTANDGFAESGPATVTLTVTPVADDPLANAGPDQQAQEEDVVTLDGTGSIDPDNDRLFYQWWQMSGPRVVFTDPHKAKTTFTAPAVSAKGAALTFVLHVSDGTQRSSTDSCVVQVADKVMEGDVDFDETIDLRDAILTLQVCSRITPAETVHMGADVNGDSSLGVEVAVYILQVIGALR